RRAAAVSAGHRLGARRADPPRALGAAVPGRARHRPAAHHLQRRPRRLAARRPGPVLAAGRRRPPPAGLQAPGRQPRDGARPLTPRPPRYTPRDPDENDRMNLKLRLVVMNFFQFFVWGAWLITIGRYWFENMHWSG